MTDGTEKIVVCHGADGTMYTPDLDANLKFPNQVVRGDYSVRKKLMKERVSVQRSR